MKPASVLATAASFATMPVTLPGPSSSIYHRSEVAATSPLQPVCAPQPASAGMFFCFEPQIDSLVVERKRQLFDNVARSSQPTRRVLSAGRLASGPVASCSAKDFGLSICRFCPSFLSAGAAIPLMCGQDLVTSLLQRREAQELVFWLLEFDEFGL
mmetsp:Transcript_20714/g.35587  ORF Transcript_20714/g.35587 Transcript_20714/m.35587 type:complete len:156 (-) Transcript_20714:91-558(-)